MKKLLLLFSVLLILGCNAKSESDPVEITVTKQKDSTDTFDLDKMEEKLKKDGYKTFTYQAGDTTYLMQQYYLVFLKSGPNRSQDSTEAANLQKQHLAFLERMGKEGFASLIGPLDSEGDIRGIAVYNTPSLKEADSLARMDPMVKAGRLEVEVHPWWTAKGGKLN